MKHFRFFSNTSTYESARSEEYVEPWVSSTQFGPINYNKSEDEKIKTDPLTFDILTAGSITWKMKFGATNVIIEYSKNGGEWTTLQSQSNPSVSVVAGDQLRFRGDTYTGTTMGYSGFTSTDCTFRVKGNVASLKFGDNLTGNEVFDTGYCFYHLFDGCTGIVSMKSLPVMSLSPYCYAYMFRGCVNLVEPPALPAPVLTEGCYGYMFYGCTSLTEGLDLSASQLVDYCYQYMFYGCSSLTTVKCLADVIDYGQSSYTSRYQWLYGVSGTGTFYKKSGVTWPTGEHGIPNGWTVVEV